MKTPADRVEENKAIAEEERIPPTAARVARRALCLAAAAGRAFLEMENMPREQAEVEAHGISAPLHPVQEFAIGSRRMR